MLSFAVSNQLLKKANTILAPHVKKNKIYDFLDILKEKYSFEPLDTLTLKRMQQELYMFVLKEYFNEQDRELLSLLSFDFTFDETKKVINIKIKNIFTLFLFYHGEMPPYPFMKNKGAGTDIFEWNNFQYYIDGNNVFITIIVR